jgi:formylglycine-generating enzyme required for sulfatase activity
MIRDRNYRDAMDLLLTMEENVILEEEKAFISEKKPEVANLMEEMKEEAERIAADREAEDEAVKRGETPPVITDKTRGAKMMLIPAGPVTVGSDSGPKISRPAHEVTVSAFYIDIKEVTNREYELFDPAHRAKRLPIAADDDIPVTNVTWEEAAAYCAWLSEQEGAVYRLPTEALWEKAARAGRDLAYSYGNTFLGNAMQVNSDSPAPHDAFPPNEFGLYNMSGNVWEFCMDWVGIYSAASAEDPVNTDPGAYNRRVMRGGSFRAPKPEVSATTYIRNPVEPDKGYPDTGFRCVREVKQETGN